LSISNLDLILEYLGYLEILPQFRRFNGAEFVDDGSEMIWKETVVVCFKLESQYLFEENHEIPQSV
jgi:hypothetical protein